MNHEDNHDGSARAMRQLVELARAVPTPGVDWERVERGLQGGIAKDATRRRVGQPRWQRHGMVAAGVFAAAAAVLALMVTAPEGTPLRSTATVGVVLSSDAEPQTFSLGSAAKCTLGPNSRALLRCQGTDADQPCSPLRTPALRHARGGLQTPTTGPSTPYVLVLEQGSVAAEVSPQPPDTPLVEALVVEAGGVRVAVHGTRFSVVRGDRNVTVEVTRGSVAVGPAGHRGVTTGHLLIAPARAAFSIDGARIARLLPTPVPPSGAGQPTSRPAASSSPSPDGTTPAERAPSAQPPSATEAARPPSEGAPERPIAAVEPGKTADGTEPTPPAELPAEPAELTAGTIDFAGAQSRIMSCLAAPSESSTAGDTVRVTISSRVRLRLDQDRRIISVRFAPPLKPELQQRCAGTVLGHTLAGSAAPPEFRAVFSPR